ncbi:MAG TPA: biotin--[acetyl-CoA-carboxylase] ligase [Lacipirellulaceae bacterium]|nr:biotin--[acetyl-CoA-carboxylase] ligase [Lacipirellulaceae bacterium]HMP05535.1 biotin--[acetyl-CoA-carboxylase] ligase [Lacipirellulaceae bacterium]
MRRVHFDQIESTNDEARRLAAEAPGEPLLVTAAVQSAGRGRQGRTWHSPRGGAWLSLAWPTGRPAAAYAAASLAAAAAVYRALCRVAPEVAPHLRIKWPNDLMLHDAKVAGILCEQLPPAGAAAHGWLIVGVGVNVDFDVALLPDNLRRRPTTLAAGAGRPVAVEAVIDALAAELRAALADFEAQGFSAALHAELQQRLADVGQRQTCTTPRGTITGRVAGLDAAGRLLLETEEHGLATCDSGELIDAASRIDAD